MGGSMWRAFWRTVRTSAVSGVILGIAAYWLLNG